VNDTVDVVTQLAARILVIDDNQAIHDDFRKIFGASLERSSPSTAELALFGPGAGIAAPQFRIDSAYQGEEGLERVRLAKAQHDPYAMAFVDVRMPPGWDGVETTSRIWEYDPDIQIVICTAYSDYSWSGMLAKLGRSDRLVILKKPFDTIEVVQLASALTEKWRLARASRSATEDLEARVAERTSELEQAVEELRRSESLKGAILESSLDCLVTIDHEGKIVEFNAAAEATFGFTRQQVLGTEMVELIVPPHLREAHRRGFAHYLATGVGPALGKRLELAAVRADGTEFPIELAISALRGTSRPIFTGFIRDITARKEADAKINRLNRVHAVLSGINALIVRVRDREELYREACRIAVEAGNFGLAWIGTFDPATEDVIPVAWAGEGAQEVTRGTSSSRNDTPRGKGAVGRAIRERRPVFNNDIAASDFGGPRLEAILGLGLRSQITLPLYEDQAVVGTLTMFGREPGFFDEQEVRLLTGLAGDISFALEHINREQKLEKLARIGAVSSEINAAIVRIDDRDALLRETARIAVECGKFDLVWIARVDRDKQRVDPVAWTGFSSEIAHSIEWTRLGTAGGILAEVARTRQVAVRTDISSAGALGPLRQDALDRGYCSNVCVPFMVGDSLVAALNLYATEREFFDAEEVALLNEMAGNISFALEHIEKAQKIARLSRIQAVTGSINALIVRVHDRAELFSAACRIAVEEGRFPRAWVGALDPATQDVPAVAWAGEGADAFTAISSSIREDTPRGQGTVGRALRTRHPVINNDIAAPDARGVRREAMFGLGVGSVIALPLFEGQAVVGALAIYAREPNFFDDQELALLTELAGDISFALQNISRRETLDKLSRVRTVSSAINAAIIRIRERKPLLEEVCRIVSEQGEFEMAWVGTLDHAAEKVEAVCWAGFSEEIAHAVSWSSISSTQGTIGEAIRTRKPSVRNNVEAQSPGGKLRQEALGRGYRSSLCLPLVVDDKVAALIVLFAAGGAFFDQDELALLNEVSSDISFALQAIEKQERLDYLAYYDVLTGLANRGLFLERVASYIRSAVTGAHKLALYVIDLERFKDINDTLGQSAGDALLKQVGQFLSAQVGEATLVARVSADQFAVVLPNVLDAQDAARLLGKTIEAFMHQRFHVGDSVLRVAGKVGIALFADDGVDADMLFRNAEAALKKAKASGDRYLFYTQKMTEMVAGKVNLENQLRQALERQEFVLHFQPKATLNTGEIAGFEALLRWQPPRGELVSPDQFIPLLEETGIIVPVGEWVLREACRQIKAWTDARLLPVPIAVNLSARQINQQDIGAMAAKMLREHGVSPRLIEFEITESAAMQNAEAGIAALQALKALGVGLSIDDFGTGYSSLSYLKLLPIDTVKIDRSFVTDLATNPDDASIAQAIINMAHNLNLRVVAEGVETESQLSFLTSHGCDQMQGYYFSRPVPAPEATAMLAENRRLQRPGVSPGDGGRTLLLLDDEQPILSSLKRLLRRDDYRILTATSAKEAFELLANHKVGVIVSDHRMPEMTGVEFLRRVKELYPSSVRMALSGYTDLDSVTDAINQGAIYRFLTKPWDDSMLRAHIAEAFRQYAKLQEVELTQEAASAKIAELTLANGLLEKMLAELHIARKVPAHGQRLIQEDAA
jgi:diguanylate cyclase (GGDEF)-like protein/PAS domain S-box-containing protein